MEKSSYEQRSENRWFGDYWQSIEREALSAGVTLRPFSTKDELKNILSTESDGSMRKDKSISHLIYYGHGYYYALALNINKSSHNITIDDIRRGDIFNPQYFSDRSKFEFITCHSASTSRRNAKVQVDVSIAETVSRMFPHSHVIGYDGRVDYAPIARGRQPEPGESYDKNVITTYVYDADSGSYKVRPPRKKSMALSICHPENLHPDNNKKTVLCN